MAHAQTEEGERRLQCMHECYTVRSTTNDGVRVEGSLAGPEQNAAEPERSGDASRERCQPERSKTAASNTVQQHKSLLCASLIGIRRPLLSCCCPLHEELLLCLVVAIRACDLDPVRQLQARERATGKGIS